MSSVGGMTEVRCRHRSTLTGRVGGKGYIGVGRVGVDRNGGGDWYGYKGRNSEIKGVWEGDMEQRMLEEGGQDGRRGEE